MNNRNFFLNALSAGDMAILEPAMRFAALERNHVVSKAEARVDIVAFPLTAVLSIVTTMSDGRSVETATVGFESGSGMIGALSQAPVATTVFAQVPGNVITIPAAAFRAAVTQSPSLFKLVMRFIQANADQADRTAACNALHDVSPRLARWLLMTADRVDAPLAGKALVPLTQEHLSIMLGVQRTTVTAAAMAFKEQGMISYARGQIRIIDRKALETNACECYAANRGDVRDLPHGAKD